MKSLTFIKFMLFMSFLVSVQEIKSQNETSTMMENSYVSNIHDKNLKWMPAPDFFPDCSFTILHGDLAKPNLDVFFKIQPNTNVVNHTHNSAERMILMSGELEVQYEEEPAVVITAGNYAYGPAKKPHRARCLNKGACVLFIALVQPFNAVPITKE